VDVASITAPRNFTTTWLYAPTTINQNSWAWKMVKSYVAYEGIIYVPLVLHAEEVSPPFLSQTVLLLIKAVTWTRTIVQDSLSERRRTLASPNKYSIGFTKRKLRKCQKSDASYIAPFDLEYSNVFPNVFLSSPTGSRLLLCVKLCSMVGKDDTSG